MRLIYPERIKLKDKIILDGECIILFNNNETLSFYKINPFNRGWKTYTTISRYNKFSRTNFVKVSRPSR